MQSFYWKPAVSLIMGDLTDFVSLLFLLRVPLYLTKIGKVIIS